MSNRKEIKKIMKQKTLPRRKIKSDVARQFIGVLNRDKKNRPSMLEVPGSNGKRYNVIVRRKIDNLGEVVTLECLLRTGCGHQNCPGNSRRKTNNTICYHSRAALDFCLNEAGFRGVWCQTEDDAQLVHRLHGGYIQRVKSHQNDATAYVLVIRKEK